MTEYAKSEDVKSLSQGERDHATRALHLKRAFGTIEKLAEFLHQQYRASAKSAGRKHPLVRTDRPILHDHGWCDCYGHMKRYFLRRAEWLLAPLPHPNGRVR